MAKSRTQSQVRSPVSQATYRATTSPRYHPVGVNHLVATTTRQPACCAQVRLGARRTRLVNRAPRWPSWNRLATLHRPLWDTAGQPPRYHDRWRKVSEPGTEDGCIASGPLILFGNRGNRQPRTRPSTRRSRPSTRRRHGLACGCQATPTAATTRPATDRLVCAAGAHTRVQY